jgi:hypothetical protein
MSESALHEQFAYCRHHREWFCPDPSLLFFIGAYATPYQPPDLIKISLAAERLGLSLWDLKALMKDLGMAPVIQTTQSTQLSFDQFATLRTHLGVIDA